MRLFRADEIVLSLGNEVSQWQEEVSIGPGRPARRNRIFGSGEIRDPENNVVFLDDMQPGDFFFLIKKKKASIAWDWACHSRCDSGCPVCHAAPRQDADVAGLPVASRAVGTKGPGAEGPCSREPGLLGPLSPCICHRPSHRT